MLSKIKMKVIGNEPKGTPKGWQKSAKGWRVMLRHGNRKYTLDFYTTGEEPTTDEVLESLVFEALLYGLTFDEWCAKVGLSDPDAYDACQAVGANMRRLLTA